MGFLGYLYQTCHGMASHREYRVGKKQRECGYIAGRTVWWFLQEQHRNIMVSGMLPMMSRKQEICCRDKKIFLLRRSMPGNT